MLTYKGFTATIAFDADDEIFVGRVLGINDVVAFHAVDDYVETRAKVGKHPEKRASGNLMLRVAPEVHAQATIAAEAAGKSLNQWAEELLRVATESHQVPRPKKRPSTTRKKNEGAAER
jgi:predicted HicB family RNase H-like nuclease